MASQAWFIAVFTAIPILMVAGALERRTLLEASKSQRATKLHKKFLLGGMAGMIAALAGISIAESEADGGWQVGIELALVGVSTLGLGLMLGLVWHSAWLVLDDNPHPDRLKSELRGIRQREAELVSQLGEAQKREADDG